MIYIFRPQASAGAVALAERLTDLGYPALKVQEINRLRSSRIVAGQAKLVCWGGATNPAWQLPGLNNIPLTDKLQDAVRLAEAGVATIQIAREQPARMEGGRTNFVLMDPGLNNNSIVTLSEAQVRSLMDRMQAWLNNPPAALAPDPNWLGRLRYHVGGNDLLNPPARPDFWVKRENIASEIRVHLFNGVSIRAGVKQPRAGVAAPHPWIRSWDGGWMIAYDGAGVRQAHRDLARMAITALGLTFGAVDIGIRPDGSALVLEVNRAPGLEGNTITAYANAIVRHFGGSIG